MSSHSLTETNRSPSRSHISQVPSTPSSGETGTSWSINASRQPSGCHYAKCWPSVHPWASPRRNASQTCNANASPSPSSDATGTSFRTTSSFNSLTGHPKSWSSPSAKMTFSTSSSVTINLTVRPSCTDRKHSLTSMPALASGPP